MATIWYISKYLAQPTDVSVGSRGFELMNELAMHGHDVHIFASTSQHLTETPKLGRSRQAERVRALTWHWLKGKRFGAAGSALRILSWVEFEFRLITMRTGRARKPDVVIVSSLSLLSVLSGLYFKRRFKARMIFEVRDIWPLTLIEEGGFNRLNPFIIGLALIERLGYRCADSIVGTMPNLREHVAKILGYEKPVHCIPMGVSSSTIVVKEPLSANYVESHVPRGSFVIGYAGTIGTTNALDTLFETAAEMHENSEMHFLIVGDGGLLPCYKDQYGHLTNVTFGPKVPKHAVPAVLAKCDLLYLATQPSRVWEYGQSLNKLIDYMLSGKPIIASYSGFPTMINEAECGTYVPADDAQALAREFRRYFAMSDAERREIGERGRTWVLKHRTFEQLASEYLAIILPA